MTDTLLRHWRAGGHKALLFTQTQQALDILEKLVVARGYAYHRMDGSTPVGMRCAVLSCMPYLLRDAPRTATRSLHLLSP